MSNDVSLLSHLLAGSSQEELFATRGLTYLLKNPACNQALLSKLNQYAKRGQSGFDVNQNCRWIEELGAKDSGRPDVTGLIDGRPRIVLEGKFWADLTSNQPAQYIRHLQTHADDECLTACLFVAPPSRLAPLWTKLQARVCDFELETIEAGSNTQWCAVRIKDKKSNKQSLLLLTHWQAALDLLSVDSTQQTKEDIAQLRALCERQDSTGFREFTDYDLSNAAARKVHQFWCLVDELGEHLIARDIGEKGGKHTTTRDGKWFSIAIRYHSCFISFHPYRWANEKADSNESSPIWFQIHSIDQALNYRKYYQNTPHFESADGRNWIFPLQIPIGKEKEDVLQDLTAQVQRITDHLKQ